MDRFQLILLSTKPWRVESISFIWDMCFVNMKVRGTEIDSSRGNLHVEKNETTSRVARMDFRFGRIDLGAWLPVAMRGREGGDTQDRSKVVMREWRDRKLARSPRTMVQHVIRSSESIGRVR
jgi:hypothetical protein